MRVFGSPVFAIQPVKSKRDAIGNVASIGVFVGYDESTAGGYKVYDPVTKHVCLRRDVCFLERWRYVRPDLLLSTAVNPALHGSFSAPVELITTPTVAYKVPRLPAPPIASPVASAFVIELACGTASASRYHLQVDPHAQILGVDILPYSVHTRAASSSLPLRPARHSTAHLRASSHGSAAAMGYTIVGSVPRSHESAVRDVQSRYTRAY